MMGSIDWERQQESSQQMMVLRFINNHAPKDPRQRDEFNAELSNLLVRFVSLHTEAQTKTYAEALVKSTSLINIPGKVF